MQIANVQVALGGDQGNRVPKYGVTPAEIVVLRAIHGTESVIEIEPAGEVTRPHAVEKSRLMEVYGGAKDEDNRPHVVNVFPGIGAQLPLTLADLALPSEFYRATARATAEDAPTEYAERQAREGATVSAALEAGGDDFPSDRQVGADAPLSTHSEPNAFE